MRFDLCRMSFPAVAASLLLLPAPSAAAPAVHPRWMPRLSAAGEFQFREELARGNYRDHPLARLYSAPALTASLPGPDDRMIAPGPFGFDATQPGLAPDARANDRMPAVSCTGNCTGLPYVQCEPTVAVHGNHVLAGWNDYEQVQCPGSSQSRQNYGYSTDGGLTFVDGNGYPANNVGSRLSGDPVHAVNHKTGQFYIAGLAGGVGGASGHFDGSSFVLDHNLRLVPQRFGADFIDKPWMNVDSLSGNVYFTWSNFVSYGVTRIEFQRFDANLQPLGPILTLSDTTGESCGAQWSQIAIGPGGVVWVSWIQYRCVSDQRLFVVRRSDDFGVTFGPQQLITGYWPNAFNGAPGMLRFLGPYPQSLVADASNGPHRGRLYAAWDEPVRYPAGPQSDTTSVVESEPNNTSLTADPFVPGGKVRGVMSPADTDWFRLDLEAGSTFFFGAGIDSMQTSFQARLWCVEDGGGLRLVANGESWGLLWTPPSDRTYYLQLSANPVDPVPYLFFTTLLTWDESSRGRDHRDQFVSWTDDGTNWSEPVRVNDSAAGYDGIYPTLGVDGRGIVHCFWIDFREDPACGAASSEYVTSSGDGGVTWGPNRRLGEGPATPWAIAVCVNNGNTQGDYMHMATDGDRVVAAFSTARLGDTDIFVDPSVHRALAGCPGSVEGVEGRDTVVAVPLVNAGNYARELSWRLEESAGWATGVVPAASGLTTLAVGETLHVEATLHFESCLGESTLVRFVHADPAMPGHEDTCVTVVRCTDGTTSALASLVSAEASPDAVTLVWFVPEAAGTPARVWRRAATGPAVALGAPERAGTARWRVTDRTVSPGARYAYRLETPTGDGPSFSGEAWVDVPARVEFTLGGLRPNPADGGEPVVRFSLPSNTAARLEAFDLSGRRVFGREVGTLGPGHHALRLDSGTLRPGIYTLRLTQAGRVASVKAAVVR